MNLDMIGRIGDAEWVGAPSPPTVDESGSGNPLRSFFQETDTEKIRYYCKHDYQWQHHYQGKSGENCRCFFHGESTGLLKWSSSAKRFYYIEI